MVKFDDPYTPTESVYECHQCGARIVSEGHVGACPECRDGTVTNIAVARE